MKYIISSICFCVSVLLSCDNSTGLKIQIPETDIDFEVNTKIHRSIMEYLDHFHKKGNLSPLKKKEEKNNHGPPELYNSKYLIIFFKKEVISKQGCIDRNENSNSPNCTHANSKTGTIDLSHSKYPLIPAGG